jgi:hypothetical protein
MYNSRGDAISQGGWYAEEYVAVRAIFGDQHCERPLFLENGEYDPCAIDYAQCTELCSM